MKNISNITFTLILFLCCSGCNKEVIEGVNGVIITEYGTYIPNNIVRRYDSESKTSGFCIENVSLYNDMLAYAVKQAEGFPITELEIESTKLHSLDVYTFKDYEEELNDYVVNCELIVFNNDEEKVLASMDSFDLSQREIVFLINDENIISMIKKANAKLFFKYTFQEDPPSEIEVIYDMNFIFKYRVAWVEER